MKRPKYYLPNTASELIGPAHDICEVLLQEVNEEIKKETDGFFRLLLHGDSGIGKTRIVTILAEVLMQGATGSNRNILFQECNGAAVTPAMVKGWMRDLQYSNNPGEWSVTIINELDQVPSQAQVLMLDYLEKLRGRRAILATSNEDIANMSKRFTSRFQQIHVSKPKAEDIQKFLKKNWPQLGARAAEIAESCEGNVRSACNDAETFLSAMRLDKK